MLDFSKFKIKNKEVNMEVKSRYEVIAELENKKRTLIISKEGMNDQLKQMERDLRDKEREVEDQKEEIRFFKEKMGKDRATYEELIKSVDDSLERLSKLDRKEK